MRLLAVTIQAVSGLRERGSSSKGTSPGLQPLAAVLVAGGVAGGEALQVEVLVVGAGVGDAPGDARVVGEVGEGGDAGEGVADDVELRAGEVVLVVDVRHVGRAVRVAGHQRLARGGATAVDRPVVAPR